MEKVVNSITSSSSIAILTHEKPDGDAIGSATSLYISLKRLGKDVDLIIPEYPRVFNYLESLKESVTDSLKDYDLVITVDCAQVSRIGQISDIFSHGKTKLVIDHHASNNNYGDINLIKMTSSCCQIIFDVILALNVEIDKNIGNALITGVLTDTGGFKNSDVDKKTFEIAGYLYDRKTEISKVYTTLMQTKSKARFELYKMAINRLELYYNDKIAFTYISKEDIDNVGAVFGDHEGLVDIGKEVEGVEVSIFLREEEDCYKISLRSNDYVDVCKIAMTFGGGGHTKAAGCNINLPFSKAKEAIIEEVGKYI